MQHVNTKQQHLATTLLALMFILLTMSAHAQTSVEATATIPMSENLTENELQNIFNNGNRIPAFKNRSASELRSKCQTPQTVWQEPATPDAQSRDWYRAATTLNATKRKTPDQYLQMLTLYEAAARKGHYRAVMQLTIAYNFGAQVRGGYFPAEPEKARLWINHGLRQGWAGSLEWLSTAYHKGGYGFRQSGGESLRFLQLAADKGVALAQHQMGLYYENGLKDLARAEVLYECAAAKGTASPANMEWARTLKIDGHPQAAMENYQKAIMFGGQSGAEAAWSMASGLGQGKEDFGGIKDKARSTAYKDLNAILEGGKDSNGREHTGNPYLRFPRLNEVLPLPPAPMPEWKGVYSAMSPEDAAYYQNPPSPEFYIEQVKNAGRLVPREFLPVFVPTKD